MGYAVHLDWRLFFGVFLMGFYLQAQGDCYLGLGGQDHDKIIAVFSLSEKQQENLKNWGAELQYRNELFKLRAKNLMQKHAQSSPEDLFKMSYEYRVLLDSMRANLRMLDKRMLGTFSDSQYNLYIQLCNSVFLSPIYANRKMGKK